MPEQRFGERHRVKPDTRRVGSYKARIIVRSKIVICIPDKNGGSISQV